MQEKVYASDNDHHSKEQPFLWIWRLIAVDAERDACDKKDQLELQCPAQANSQGALRAHKMQGLRHVPCSWTHHPGHLNVRPSVHLSIKTSVFQICSNAAEAAIHRGA